MNYHLFRLKKYLDLSYKMWSIILFNIDSDYINKVYSTIDVTKIINTTYEDFKDDIIDNGCLTSIIKIRLIFEIINLYIISKYNIYMFFRLSNVIKISYNKKINFERIDLANKLFQNLKIDNKIWNNTIIENINVSDLLIKDIRNKIGYPNIKELYLDFYKYKNNLFLNEFKNTLQKTISSS